MKKLLSFIVVFGFIFVLTVPCFALEPQIESQSVSTQTLSDGTIVTSTITVFKSTTRASTRKATAVQDYERKGVLIATVSLTATFAFDGEDAWVHSTSSSNSTYNGWSYENEKIATSGDTAKLTAKLTKSGEINQNVKISLTCSPTGEITSNP